jgi:hypothetical protein
MRQRQLEVQGMHAHHINTSSTVIDDPHLSSQLVGQQGQLSSTQQY